MKSAFTLWANLEAARDDSSMNLNYEKWPLCAGLTASDWSAVHIRLLNVSLLFHFHTILSQWFFFRFLYNTSSQDNIGPFYSTVLVRPLKDYQM